MTKYVLSRFLSFSLLLLSTSIGWAESGYDAALRRMLDRPGSPDRMFAYGQSAAQAGDPTGVAIALERLLAFEPSLSNIRFELGLLYLRAGNPGLAASYLEEALTDPSVPDDIRERGLALIEEATDATRVWSHWGEIRAGVRHDTNANAGPDGTVQFVTSIGEVQGRLRSEDTGQADVAASLALSGGLSADLGFQAGHRFVLPGLLYFEKYREQNQLDIDFANLAPGIAFNFRNGGDRSGTVTVSLLGAHLRRGGDDYLTESGAAVEAIYRGSQQTLLRGGVSGKDQDFRNTEDAPVNDLRDGALWGAYIGAVRDLGTQTQISAEIFGRRKEAEVDFEAYREWGLFAQVRRLFAAPILDEHGPWEARFSATYSVVDYDDLDLSIDLDTAQQDKRLRLEAQLIAPVTQSMNLTARIGHYDNNSNFAIRAYDNTYVALELAHRF